MVAYYFCTQAHFLRGRGSWLKSQGMVWELIIQVPCWAEQVYFGMMVMMTMTMTMTTALDGPPCTLCWILWWKNSNPMGLGLVAALWSQCKQALQHVCDNPGLRARIEKSQRNDCTLKEHIDITVATIIVKARLQKTCHDTCWFSYWL